MLDANQSLADCFSGKRVKPYSIEWLRLQCGLDDPFIQLVSSRPNSTTLTPNHDIDYILTHGIQISNISTLEPNTPAHSDHLGIVFDINMADFFLFQLFKYLFPISKITGINLWKLTHHLSRNKSNIISWKTG
jgi:hypothetical protein